MIRLLLLLLLVSTSLSASANICQYFKEDSPVLAGGRVKPYFVLAKESLKFIMGKSKFNDEEPTLTFCRLMLQTRLKTRLELPIRVEHIKTKAFLGLKESTNTMSSHDILPKKEMIRSEIFKQQENTPYKKDLSKLFSRITTLEQITQGLAYTIYTGDKKKENLQGWEPLSHFKKYNKEDFLKVLINSKIKYENSFNSDYLLELTYVKSHIYSYSLLISIMGIFLTVLFKSLRWGVTAAIITLIIQTVAMGMRVLISGRAPITNMYETVLFSGTGALVIALIILYTKREKIFLLAALGYNILCLFMMSFANNMLSSSISPLVPVLRDNFWLSTHVTSIMLSYAALALSWLVANITLTKQMFNKMTPREYRHHQSLIYTCIKVGIVLLAIGIILGGIWADYSWGRFWGWDPKETWSLIVLLYYMAMVHGKYSSWINTHRFVMLSAAGFMTVMMAWFGVNYILASGLHSYGFSEGGAIFLGVFFLVQIVFLIICALTKKIKSVL